MATGPLTENLRKTVTLFDEAGEPRTTTEVAAHLDVDRRSTYERLEQLVDHGWLETKTVGANARVWWRPAAETDRGTRDWSATAESLVDDALNDAAVGVFVLDEDYEVAWINETAERYFGLDREQVVGRDRSILVTEHIAPVVADADRLTGSVPAPCDDTDAREFECHVTGGEDRAERWLEHRSNPIESGTYAGGRVELYYDITDRKRSERSHREDREELASLVEAVEEYAIFTLDTEGYVQTWNPGAERIKGYAREDVLGEHFSTFYTEEDRAAGVPTQNLTAAADEGAVEDEGWRVRADGSRFWANVTITAIRDADGELEGYAKVTRDMTERREYEQQLEEEKAFVQGLLNSQQDVFYAYDTEGTLFRWNDRFNEVTGYTDAEIETLCPADFVADEVADQTTAAMERILERGDTVTIELPLVTADGEDVPYEFTGGPITDENGDIVGATGLGRDVSDRKARECRLERQRDELEAELNEVFARMDDAFFALDDDWRFTHVSDRAADVFDRSVGELVGRTVWDVFPETRDSTFQKEYERAVETQETITFEEYSPPLETWLEARAYPSESGLSVYFRDITERKERERELERYRTIVETVGDAIYVVDGEQRFTMVNQAAEELSGYSSEQIVDMDVADVIGETAAERARELGDTLSMGDQEVAAAEFTLTTADGQEVAIDTRFTCLPTEDGSVERVGVARDISERKQREQTLVQQREYLTALNNLNAVARDITDAVIEQSTREEIEETVCERLAASDSYRFAWIGDVDASSQAVSLRTEAGVDGYLDDITISVDPDDDRSAGPTAEALRTGTVRTTQDVDRSARHDPWREHVSEYDWKSSAAIPIAHEGTVYSVLNVYADRPHAFEGQERDVIAQLGQIVGHAIAAAERKQALMSDELVELEFQIEDVFGALDLSDELSGRITLDHAVPVADDEFLVYGTATPDAVDTVRTLVEDIPYWEAVTVRSGDEDDTVGFEVRLTDPPVLSVVASLGGYVESAVIENGGYRMTIHLAPSVDVRRVIDAVQEAYPQAEMLRRHQISRVNDTRRPVQSRVLADLSDRQRTALEAAYHAGFFEWPRDASGEDVADSLGVSSPTFHQHLRKAEKKVFDVILSTEVQSAG